MKELAPYNIESLPEAIQYYMHKAQISDSSCSDTAKTLFIEGSARAYLKIDKEGKLARERIMTAWMHNYGLTPKVLEYASENGMDYLLKEALEGEDGISWHHKENPQRLAAVFGESLRLIHALPKENCPFQNRTIEMLEEADSNAKQKHCDMDFIPEGIEHAYAILSTSKLLAGDDVVLHGDYCLPNIIMHDYRLAGFVDLGYGGVGDRHWDLFWGIWTLKYNLKTEKYKDTFLDAYGRETLNLDKLELCRLLAGLTG
jgi:kanamycin kinase